AVPRVKRSPPLPLRFRHDGAFKILQVGSWLPGWLARPPLISSAGPAKLAVVVRWRTCTSATAPPRAAGTWRRRSAARAAPTATPRASCAGSSKRRGPTS
uniref:Uncharacterized protein n=1 Tax=Aegilops tauschii subsp. strangulata TaxID=200361 RepID=A0A453SPR9_AEGTS